MIYRDKVFHALGGAAIFGFAAFFMPSVLAFAVVWLVAGLKEQLIDKPAPERHTFDGWDAYWTAGGAVGMAVLMWGMYA